jgi:hypothetical protein
VFTPDTIWTRAEPLKLPALLIIGFIVSMKLLLKVRLEKYTEPIFMTDKEGQFLF